MFPFCKTPPTKAEIAKKTVSDAAHALVDAVPTELIEDKFDDLKKSAVAIALQAAQVAHHASEVASHKLEDLQHAASAFGETAAAAAHRASDSAHLAGEGAAAAAAIKAKAAKEAAQSAKETLQGHAATLQGHAGTLKDSAVSLKSSLQERASHDLEAGKTEALNAKAAAQHEAEVLRGKAEAVKAKFAGKKEEVEEKIAAIEVPEIKGGPIEVQYSDTSSKWLWILLGLAVGAALAILFAPTSGRRSRAAIKDRLGKVGDGAVDAATATSDKVIDIANRVEGIAHKVEAKIVADSEADDDGTLADRVRSVLGHHEVAKTLERINVDSSQGVITLRGPIIDVATQEIIVAAVKAVPGVKDVIPDFLTDETPADPSTYAS